MLDLLRPKLDWCLLLDLGPVFLQHSRVSRCGKSLFLALHGRGAEHFVSRVSDPTLLLEAVKALKEYVDIRRSHGRNEVCCLAIVLWARHGGDEQVPQTYSRNLPLLPQREESATPPPSCNELSLALCKRPPLASPHPSPPLPLLPSASNILTLGGREVRFDVSARAAPSSSVVDCPLGNESADGKHCVLYKLHLTTTHTPRDYEVVVAHILQKGPPINTKDIGAHDHECRDKCPWRWPALPSLHTVVVEDALASAMTERPVTSK